MNLWDERFKQEHYLYGKEPNTFLATQLSALEQATTVACYAEGEGRNAVFLAQQGFEVTAYDYSTEGLQKTAQLAAEMNVAVATKKVDLIHDDLLSEHYDAAVMVFGHFAKRDQQAIFDKIMASLKPGGRFLVEVYEEAQLAYKTGGPPQIEYLYNAEQLQTWAQAYHIVHFFAGETERHEGTGHTGKCAVVQLIIEK